MDNYEFDIGVENLQSINFTGEYLISSKKTEEGYYKCSFYEKKPNGEEIFTQEDFCDNKQIRKRIEKEFFETLSFIIQNKSVSAAVAISSAEYNIFELKMNRNSYLIFSLLGLCSSIPISLGVNYASTEPGKAAILIIGGVICAIGSIRIFKNFENCIKKIKQAQIMYNEFLLDEGKQYVRKK